VEFGRSILTVEVDLSCNSGTANEEKQEDPVEISREGQWIQQELPQETED
jgi:hypothetical protein